MTNFFRRSLAVLLTVMLLLSLGTAAVFASGEAAGSEEASGEASGGSSGGGGQEFGTFGEVAASAGVIIENGAVRYAENWDGTASGEITVVRISSARSRSISAVKTPAFSSSCSRTSPQGSVRIVCPQAT